VKTAYPSAWDYTPQIPGTNVKLHEVEPLLADVEVFSFIRERISLDGIARATGCQSSLTEDLLSMHGQAHVQYAYGDMGHMSV
jgi:hypothetical protein